MRLMTPEHHAALRALSRRLGPLAALRIALAVRHRVAHGEPFRLLPPPDDDEHRNRRARLGPVIVLFDVLRRRYGDPRAIKLCADVVEAGVAVYFDARFGRLDRARLAAMNDAERAALVHHVERSLPHVVVHFARLDHDELRFTVVACKVVRLCHEAGCPELAPLFCAGDARYFARLDPTARLDRPTTLASGGACCPFVVRFGP